MGTNYYLHVDPCPACEHPAERVHIGKSSYGWCFSLAIHPDRGINDLEDWLPLFESQCIVDEYGRTVSGEEMVSKITERHHPTESDPWDSERYIDDADFHERNQSQRGPHGLLRHRLGERWVKHGEGTWDCIVGEFS